MSNTVNLVINALIDSITLFLQTDIAEIFISVIIVALVLRLLIKILNMKGGRV